MAGNGVTTTTTPGMARAANTINETQSNIAQVAGQVQSHIATLMAAWEGAAATAYKRATEPWFDDVKRILSALQRQEEALTQNRQNITRAEENQASDASAMAAQVAVNF